jgi:hypothetical protein
MQIKKFNISKPKKYMKGNEEKTQWNNIGTITEFHKDDGSVNRIIEIPSIGLEASIFPFTENRDRATNTTGEAKKPAERSDTAVEVEYPAEEINPDDIPF